MNFFSIFATLLAFASSALASDISSGGVPRTLACPPNYKVFHSGEPTRVKQTNPEFFNWGKSEERLFALKTGECIHLPFWVDDAKSLGLNFLAPLNEINERLREHKLEAIPLSEYESYGLADSKTLAFLATMTSKNGKNAVSPSEFESSALITIGGNDFANTPAGPIRPSMLFTYVKPSARCYLSKENCAKPTMFFWKYYVNTLRAKYAGEETWGLQKKMGSGVGHYQGPVKSYSYYDGESTYSKSTSPTQARVYSMKWDQTKNPVLVTLIKGQPIPGTEILFPGYEAYLVGVTQAATRESAKLKTNPGQTFNLMKWKADGVYTSAFNQETDEFIPNYNFDFLAPIKELSYLKPFYWQYLSNVSTLYYTDQPPAK